VCANRAWDVLSGDMKCVLSGHDATVVKVAVSADNKTCVTGSKDKSVRYVIGTELSAENL